MFRFTIRDVLWLMVVVGLGLGWYLHDRSWKRYYDDTMQFVVREANDSTLRIIELSGEINRLKKSRPGIDDSVKISN